MIVELISVGTELLMGNIINTNAAYLASRCADLGAICYFQEVVGDNPARLEETVGRAVSRADVVTIHIPLIPATRHFIDAEKLALMKESAYLINASRGPIVEEKALIEALKNKKIKGAALDVQEFEPNVNPELAALDNIVMTPHCCTNIAEVRVSMIHELLEGVRTLLNGEKPYNLVC